MSTVRGSPPPPPIPQAVEGEATAHLARMCRALGHPARLRILRHLKATPCCCGDIVRLLPLAQSTVSQHLKHLRDCGLIVGRSQGATTCYDLNEHLLEDLKRHLLTLL